MLTNYYFSLGVSPIRSAFVFNGTFSIVIPPPVSRIRAVQGCLPCHWISPRDITIIYDFIYNSNFFHHFSLTFLYFVYYFIYNLYENNIRTIFSLVVASVKVFFIFFWVAATWIVIVIPFIYLSETWTYNPNIVEKTINEVRVAKNFENLIPQNDDNFSNWYQGNWEIHMK